MVCGGVTAFNNQEPTSDCYSHSFTTRKWAIQKREGDGSLGSAYAYDSRYPDWGLVMAGGRYIYYIGLDTPDKKSFLT